MLFYVVKKVLLIIPTVILVIVLAFFLSKLTPGDAAESLMTIQGVLPQNSNSTHVYETNYKQLHLDKPDFYLSVQPDFFPENINSIITPSKRKEVKTFLYQKYDFRQITQYQKDRDSYVKSIPEMLQDTLLSVDVKNKIEASRKLLFTTSINDIQNIIKSISDVPAIASNNSFLALKASIEELIRAKKTSYLPKLVWHGSNNQFHLWASGLFTGNMGVSIKDGRKVADKIGPALKWTMLLLILNLIFTILIAIPTGVYSGYKKDSFFDGFSNFFWLMLYSMPVFWLASMLIIYFTSDTYGTWLNIFPPPGSWVMTEDMGLMEMVRRFSGQLVLPIICLVANDIAYLSRLTRNNIIFQQMKGFVTMAKAKGLDDRKILTRHILPNALIPIITIIAGSIPAGLSGSLIIEVIFNIPGMGRLMFDSIYSSDWNVVFGILIIISIFTIIFLLLADLLYGWLNPKIKLA
jgi:peptide/nickel transport system permease protein